MQTLRLDLDDLGSHIANYGDTGSGKTSLNKQLLLEIERRGETAIVFDPDREFARAFRDVKRGDFILDPGVAECPFWPIGEEVTDEADAYSLATCMFPDRTDVKDPFWTQAARGLLAYLLAYHKPTTAQLGSWMSHEPQIDMRVKGTEFERILTANSPAQRAGVLSHLNLAAQPLRMMPATSEGRRRFTVREWCQRRDSWIFVTSKPSYSAAMKPLHASWLSSLIKRVIDMGRRKDLPRVWFIFEEAASLVIDEFHLALVRLRKTGCPVVYAIQNFADLKAVYGEKAETIFGQAKTKVLFRCSNPDSAKKLEAAAGMKTVHTLRETRSWGRNGYQRSWTMQKEHEPVIPAAEIMSWADREGVLLQPGVAVRIKIPIVDLPDREPAIVERPIPPMEHRQLQPMEAAAL